MGRAPRSYALESSPGLCGSDTCTGPMIFLPRAPLAPAVVYGMSHTSHIMYSTMNDIHVAWVLVVTGKNTSNASSRGKHGTMT